MNKVIGFLNNRYFVAAVVALFLLSLLRRFSGR